MCIAQLFNGFILAQVIVPFLWVFESHGGQEMSFSMSTYLEKCGGTYYPECKGQEEIFSEALEAAGKSHRNLFSPLRKDNLY